MKLRFKEHLALFCKKLFPLEKKSIVYHGSLFVALIVVINSLAVLFAHLPSNKSMSLAEISEKVKNELSDEPATIIYGKEIVPNSYEILSCEPEKSKTMRSIYSKQRCFDGYLANWDNKYSPIVVNTSGTTKKYSLLLWPKNGYRDSQFLYRMPLIAGSVKSHSTSQDIYITKTYADELISNCGSGLINNEASKYEQLLSKTPYIEFDYETTSSTSRTFQLYFLCGIIDDNSDEYKNYQALFGDYFISNQYLNLPIPHFTYFETTTGLYNKRNQIKTIFNVYKYEANRLYGSAIETQYAYEYRLFFIGETSSQYSIYTMWDETNNTLKSINQVFDLFCYGGSVLTIVVSIALSIALLFTVFFLSWRIKKNNLDYFKNKDEDVSYKVWKIMKYCLYLSVVAVLGFLCLKITKIMVPSLGYLSINSFLTPLLYFVVAFIIVVVLFAFRKGKKKI